MHGRADMATVDMTYAAAGEPLADTDRLAPQRVGRLRRIDGRPPVVRPRGRCAAWAADPPELRLAVDHGAQGARETRGLVVGHTDFRTNSRTPLTAARPRLLSDPLSLHC